MLLSLLDSFVKARQLTSRLPRGDTDNEVPMKARHVDTKASRPREALFLLSEGAIVHRCACPSQASASYSFPPIMIIILQEKLHRTTACFWIEASEMGLG